MCGTGRRGKGLGRAIGALSGGLAGSVAMAQFGLQEVGAPPGGTSQALAVSADGLTVAGTQVAGGIFEAFRWTSAAGRQGLGDLAGGATDSRGYAVNSAGTVVEASQLA